MGVGVQKPRQHLARLASRLATCYNTSKSQATSNLYRRLNLTLVRVNVRALKTPVR